MFTIGGKKPPPLAQGAPGAQVAPGAHDCISINVAQATFLTIILNDQVISGLDPLLCDFFLKEP